MHPIYCSSCGKPNAFGAKFCNECATPLHDVLPPGQQSQEAPRERTRWEKIAGITSPSALRQPHYPPAPIPQQKPQQKVSNGMIALILIGALAVFFIVSLVPEDVKKGQKGNQPASTVAAEIPASPITASDLASAYEANEVRADSNYKDKMLAVTGTVDLIQSTLFGSLYVSLKDESKQYSFMSITCYFPDEAKNQLANLSKGQKVTVTGKCGGKTMSIVSLRDCRLN